MIKASRGRPINHLRRVTWPVRASLSVVWCRLGGWVEGGVCCECDGAGHCNTRGAQLAGASEVVCGWSVGGR